MSYYLKKNWKMLLFPFLFALLTQAAYCISQVILMYSIQYAFALDLRSFLIWTGFCTLAFAAHLGFGSVQGAFEANSKRKLNNQVRHDLYLSLLEKNHSEYHSQDNGEYLSWMSNSIKQINTLGWTHFFTLLDSIAAIVCSVIVLLALNWILLAVALMSVVVMTLLPKLFEKKMEQMGSDCVAAEEQGVSRIKDLLAGLDVMRSFGRTKRFLQDGDQASDLMERPNSRLEKTQTYVTCGVGFVSIVLQSLQQIVTVILAINGGIAVGAVITASNLTAALANGLSSVAKDRVSMSSAEAYFKNITTHNAKESPDAPSLSAEQPPLPEDTDQGTALISLEHVSFAYKDAPVLTDVSLSFEKGGKYVLTGPSGCGKSTVLKLLLGWLPTYSGTISFGGKDARSFSPEQLQEQMSYIEQSVFLFNTTIRDNITLGNTFTDAQMQAALHGSALDQDLAGMPLGLDTPVGENGSSLSGGQKQRVAIARALIHGRSILLVDEGTSALDQKNADIVEECLLAEPNLTLILVSHHLRPERRAQFTNVYEMKKG